VTESDELARISHSGGTERERRRERKRAGQRREAGAREGENEPATVMEADLPAFWQEGLDLQHSQRYLPARAHGSGQSVSPKSRTWMDRAAGSGGAW